MSDLLKGRFKQTCQTQPAGGEASAFADDDFSGWGATCVRAAITYIHAYDAYHGIMPMYFNRNKNYYGT
eukprot:617079-Amphidinium_carterae.1